MVNDQIQHESNAITGLFLQTFNVLYSHRQATVVGFTPKRWLFFNIGPLNTKRKLLPSEQIYWLLQAGGWFLYWLVSTLVNIYINGLPDKRRQLWQEEIGVTLFVIFGLLVTHIYRWHVKSNKWVNLPVGRLVRQIIVSIVLLSIAIAATYLGVLWRLGIILSNELSYLLLIRIYINTAIIISLWIAIYFSVQYFNNFRKTQVQKLKQDALIKEATLNKLRSQLNPHFIFNSLNSIRALVLIEPDKARDSITALSNIFRKTLQLDKAIEVSFGEEMQIVEDYLKLEKIRFEERLEYSWEIEPEVYGIKIPPLMLQTLVENGIKHGVSTLTTGGFVQIKAVSNVDATRIEIRNSGNLKPRQGGRKGYGLQNTRERLNLLYGNGAEIKLEQEAANVVLTTLTIPK
ncbi:histidine kinase [bacterium]|nr:histidine kinase [bacterium]